MPYILLAVDNILYAGIPTLLKLGLSELDAVQLVWLKHSMALLVVAPVALLIPQSKLRVREIFQIILAAVLAFTITSLLQVESVARSGAAIGALMVALQPIVTIILAGLFLHERISFQMVACVAVAVAGLILLCGNDAQRIEGGLIYVVAILCESSLGILLRPLLKRHRPIHIAFYCLIVASALLMPFQSDTVIRLGTISNATWGSILYLGGLCSGVCTVIWLKSLQRVDVSHSAIMWFIQPLGGSFLAAIALGESITPNVVVGGLLILFAVIFLVASGNRDTTTGNVPPPRMMLRRRRV